MLPYLIPILITLLCTIKYDINGNNDVWKKIGYLTLYFYWVILLGIRYKVGGDTINYMGYYDWQPDLDTFEFTFGDLIQPGYNLLCAFAKSISPEFYVFQIIHALIVNTLLFVFLWKNTKYVFSALLSFYFVGYMYFTCEILREAIAILIFAFLCKPLYRGEWLKYYLGVALCVMFHMSALILIFFPFLRKIKFNKTYLLIMMITAVAMMGLKSILSAFSDIMLIGDKVSNYANEHHGMLADLLAMMRKSIFPIMFACVVKFGCHRKLKYENQIALLGLFGFMAFFNPVLFGRISNYVILFFAISFADEIILFIKSHRVRLRHNAIILSLCFCLLYGSGYTMYKVYQLYIPYSSIFKPVEYNRNIHNV